MRIMKGVAEKRTKKGVAEMRTNKEVAEMRFMKGVAEKRTRKGVGKKRTRKGRGWGAEKELSLTSDKLCNTYIYIYYNLCPIHRYKNVSTNINEDVSYILQFFCR